MLRILATLSTSGNEERKHWFRFDGFRVKSPSKCFGTIFFLFFFSFWPQYFSGSNNGQASLMKTCPCRPFGEEGFLACVFRSLPTEAVAVRILKGYDDLGWIIKALGWFVMGHMWLLPADAHKAHKRSLSELWKEKPYIGWLYCFCVHLLKVGKNNNFWEHLRCKTLFTRLVNNAQHCRLWGVRNDLICNKVLSPEWFCPL